MINTLSKYWMQFAVVVLLLVTGCAVIKQKNSVSYHIGKVYSRNTTIEMAFETEIATAKHAVAEGRRYGGILTDMDDKDVAFFAPQIQLHDNANLVVLWTYSFVPTRVSMSSSNHLTIYGKKTANTSLYFAVMPRDPYQSADSIEMEEDQSTD